VVGARWSKFVAVVVMVAAASACSPSAASAEGEEDTGGFGAFHLKGTNGYSILVMGFSRPHFKHGEVIVWAARRHASVIYLASARVTGTAIEADLGAAGELAVEFQPEGAPERVHASCEEGSEVTFQPGSWVGKIEITGEENFTTAERTQAKAIVSPFIEAGCGVSVGGEAVGHGYSGARLVARAAGIHRSRFIQANQNRPGGPMRIEADLEERRGDLIVDRTIEDTFPGSGLHFEAKLRTATLVPPSPFSGSATFHRNAKPANRWTGDLTLDFPGRADVPMAGHAFESTLAHAHLFHERRVRRYVARFRLRDWADSAR
jgi:hypothetical protein